MFYMLLKELFKPPQRGSASVKRPSPQITCTPQPTSRRETRDPDRPLSVVGSPAFRRPVFVAVVCVPLT